MKKNLVIGSIIKYRWEEIEPFFESFAQSGFENCECVMFVAHMSEYTLNKIKSFGVKLLPIPPKYDGKCIIDYRWDLYTDFLRDKQKDYDMIFTADVRDLFFQSDMFKFYQRHKKFLGVALEDVTLSEPCNKWWFVRRFGEADHEPIKNERVICMGTLWGTSEEFFNFSETMSENLKSDKYNYYEISDQPTANWFVYHEKLFNDILVTSTNQDGPVMTIGLSERENIKLDSNDNVLNGKGEIAAVVHQYDRKPDIVIKVVDKYCPNMNRYYYNALIRKKPGLFWRFMRYYYRVRKIGLFKALYITIRKRLPGGENFG
ncbi:MAG: hypothetical protein IJT21_04235 [Synergistaceae bacterium]|nr:hypothetical protein [Synergistaceae bacterium]